ncbi:MAG: hypothetical protein B6U73_04830 [Desulfurococcales archaeon ex4484_204]|nr:MAG: hypothetical protein B6U73_04830 [Desulfurococcales archaeon ex4484_204]
MTPDPPVLWEVTKLVRGFMERRGVLTWLTSLFNRSVEKDVVREVVEELRRRGLLRALKKR